MLSHSRVEAFAHLYSYPKLDYLLLSPRSALQAAPASSAASLHNQSSSSGNACRLLARLSTDSSKPVLALESPGLSWVL